MVLSIILVLLLVFAEAGTPAVIETAVASTMREGVMIPVYYTLPVDPSSADAMAVLIHGHHGDYNERGGFDAITNELAANGILAVTLDFPGCGASAEDFRNNAMSCMCADVADVIAATKTLYGIKKTGVMGYSMGGRIVCQMLIEDMAVFDTIVFVAPAVSLADLIRLFRGQQYYDHMKAAIAGTTNMFPFPGPHGKQPLSNRFFNDLEKYDEDLVALAAAKYEGRSLTIYSTNDTTVSPSVSQACADAFGSIVITNNVLEHSYSFYGTEPATKACLNTAISTFLITELGK